MGHTNVWAPFTVDVDARARLPAGRHAEQRLVRRRAARRQPVRRVASSASTRRRGSACGTSRSCTTGSGTTTCRRRRSWRRFTRTDERVDVVAMVDEAGLRVRVRSRDRQAGLADRGARRCRRATCRASARRRRSRSRRSRRRSRSRASREDDVIDFTPELEALALDGDAAATASGPLYTPPSLQGTIVMPGAIGGGGMGRRRVRPGDRACST